MGKQTNRTFRSVAKKNKIKIIEAYPTIGIQIKAGNDTIEKCFIIQEGTTGQIHLFGWKPKLLKARNILVFERMINCNGFLAEQRKNLIQIRK